MLSTSNVCLKLCVHVCLSSPELTQTVSLFLFLYQSQATTLKGTPKGSHKFTAAQFSTICPVAHECP